ncbi:unnamed protein product, partial [Mesorhabditis spiculigera]
MHGGIGPELTRRLARDGFEPDDDSYDDLRTALLWSDPNHQIKGEECGTAYALNHRRGKGYYYGGEAIATIRQDLGIDFIVRAHQEMDTGVRFFEDWLISVYTTSWRAPQPATPEARQKQNESEDLSKEVSPEATKHRRDIIEAMEEEGQIGGVLVYDGIKFTMIHFIPVNNKPYQTDKAFAKAFETKRANELCFAENNCEESDSSSSDSSTESSDEVTIAEKAPARRKAAVVLEVDAKKKDNAEDKH